MRQVAASGRRFPALPQAEALRAAARGQSPLPSSPPPHTHHFNPIVPAASAESNRVLRCSRPAATSGEEGGAAAEISEAALDEWIRSNMVDAAVRRRRAAILQVFCRCIHRTVA